MSVHVHATAFDRVADDYELGRPGYPSALRDWIATRYRTTPGTVIVDLGAGTGKLTRLLVGTGATVVGVEPLENMRRVFARVLPGVELRHGTAQSIPFADGTVDLVTCGQSFRWFAVKRPFGRSPECFARKPSVFWCRTSMAPRRFPSASNRC